MGARHAARHVRASLRRAVRVVGDYRSPRATLFRWLLLPDARVAPALWSRSKGAASQDRVVLGEGVRIGDQAEVILGPEGRVVIGDGTTVGRLLVVAADLEVRIGAGCHIGDLVAITDTWTYGRTGGPPPEPVAIGDRCRIGARTTIGPGTVLSDNADVPPGSLL